MRARLALVPLLAALLAVAWAPPAGAAGLLSRLELRADGYRVFVVGHGDQVEVDVRKPRSRGEAMTGYLVHGTVARERLRARFGDLGSISMRFQGGTVTRPHGCHGRHRFLIRHGAFVGSFRFRGEGGYVSIAARRAKGTAREVAPSCLGRRPARAARAGVPHSEGVKQRPEYGYVFGSWRHAGSSAAVLASKSRQGKTELIATQEAIRGAMSITRLAFAETGAKSLRTNDSLTRAWLDGVPAPFAGQGRYVAAADGHRTWEGSLTVDFPGLAGFPLTGPDYEPQAGRTATPGFLFFLLFF